jgi:hypothetical protein
MWLRGTACGGAIDEVEFEEAECELDDMVGDLGSDAMKELELENVFGKRTMATDPVMIWTWSPCKAQSIFLTVSLSH